MSLKGLVKHLRQKREHIVRRKTVQTVDFDPTFGAQVRSEEIEVIDFDALISEIDEFTRRFE